MQTNKLWKQSAFQSTQTETHTERERERELFLFFKTEDSPNTFELCAYEREIDSKWFLSIGSIGVSSANDKMNDIDWINSFKNQFSLRLRWGQLPHSLRSVLLFERARIIFWHCTDYLATRRWIQSFTFRMEFQQINAANRFPLCSSLDALNWNAFLFAFSLTNFFFVIHYLICDDWIFFRLFCMRITTMAIN